MKRPSWATVVGVLGIIIGCFGIIGGAQLATKPMLIKMQKEILSIAQKSVDQEKSTNSQSLSPEVEQMFKMHEQMFDFPEWYNGWCVFAGLLGMIISGFYLFASIRILQVNPVAIQLFYWVSGFDISLIIIKATATILASSFMAFAAFLGGMIWIIIEGVLLIIVITGRKEAFEKKRLNKLLQQTAVNE